MMRRVLLTGLVASVSLLGSIAATAVPITFTFQATVDSIEEAGLPASDFFSVGQVLEGRFTFESDTPPAGSVGFPAGTADYSSPIISFVLTGPSFSTLRDPFASRFVIRDSTSIPDLFSLGVTWRDTDPFDVPAGFNGDAVFNFDLSDSQRTALDTNALPLLPPDLDEFELRKWRIQFVHVEVPLELTSAVYWAEVSGRIVSLSHTPEPSGHLLVGIGLLALAARRVTSGRRGRGGGGSGSV
jgi:hypothetical protein